LGGVEAAGAGGAAGAAGVEGGGGSTGFAEAGAAVFVVPVIVPWTPAFSPLLRCAGGTGGIAPGAQLFASLGVAASAPAAGFSAGWAAPAAGWAVRIGSVFFSVV